MSGKSIILVFSAHQPFLGVAEKDELGIENSYFESLSNIYLPLLRVFSNLEADGIPFKLALSISPQLCAKMESRILSEKYVEFLEKQYALALEEQAQSEDNPEKVKLINNLIQKIIQNRRDFVETYNLKILHKISYYAKKGNIELLGTGAGFPYMPLYSDCNEVINAHIETGLIAHRAYFGTNPTGFWLPSMGYSSGLEFPIKSYGYQYTILETHSLLFANPAPRQGVFSTVLFPNSLTAFARDFNSVEDIKAFMKNPVYKNCSRDIGFELEKDRLSAFSDFSSRPVTGIGYWNNAGNLYSFEEAEAQALRDSREFIKNRKSVLDKAAGYMDKVPFCLCAMPIDILGKKWFEGALWLENLFRTVAEIEPDSGGGLSHGRDLFFSLPSEILAYSTSREKIRPLSSSWNPDGYGEELLEASNEWMYRFARNAALKMVDLTVRFPNDSGLKERTLNLAAKEVLLSQDIVLSSMVRGRIYADYAVETFENHITAFSTVYDSLGGNSVSTEWLTEKERCYPVFPGINYRSFGTKK